jgi:hypothetical protein
MAANPYRPGREHTARTHPVVPAIYQTTTFELDDTAYADLLGRDLPALGGVETLASVPFNSSHFNMTARQRLEAGIPPGLLRLSVGLEGEEALVADLRRAIAATAGLSP